MNYNPEIHHRSSIRLKGYDYSVAGAYFVTICAQGRECLFGEIVDGTMELNNSGRMAENVWLALPERFPDMVVDEFVIMPNHFHGVIVCIGRGESRIRPKIKGDHKDQGDHEDRPYGTAEGSVGRIVQAFKSLTTNAYIRGVKQSDWPPFAGRLWQRNYYERIVRNDDELNAARKYILDNPMKWGEDVENPEVA